MPLKSNWSNQEAAKYIARYATEWGDDLALRTYSSRLIGSEEDLVLHGGGNTSVKGMYTNLWKEAVPAIHVKASGCGLAAILPQEYSTLNLAHLQRLQTLPSLSDDLMLNEFRTHVLRCEAPTPSIETLVHAFLPPKYIDHTHADAILALTNQVDGDKVAQEAMGANAIVLPYFRPGFDLAKAAANAFAANPGAQVMVWMHHGLTTWGDTARESYERTIEYVSRAEEYLAKHAKRPLVVETSTPLETAIARAEKVAPIVRGLLAEPTGVEDFPFRRVILQTLVNRNVLDFVDSSKGKILALSPPLTSDHLIRTKASPLWVDKPDFLDSEKLRIQVSTAIKDYVQAYEAYFQRNAARIAPHAERFDPYPRVVLIPGVGALCAGRNALASKITKDITNHTLGVKTRINAMGEYLGLSEPHLFDMEYHNMQRAKLKEDDEPPLSRQVALVTGAAGAIGSAISQGLLKEGCQVVLTDLPGPRLNSLTSELGETYPEQVLGVPLDVTDPASVTRAFRTTFRTWGGIDLIVVNAGAALASSLADINPESFRNLERINVEGALWVLAEAARHFQLQRTGGDVVLVSTKNVFAPGAGFGAYSATKAAAHQLARIASLEFAPHGVRVNMVAPDAVFAHGSRRSGLWDSVGPERMRARGLDEKGLKEYYRNRNLLKTRITAEHVANAVLFFATRQTPTTGATLPVDGGLPDATPR